MKRENRKRKLDSDVNILHLTLKSSKLFSLAKKIQYPISTQLSKATGMFTRQTCEYKIKLFDAYSLIERCHNQVSRHAL